MFVLHFYKRKKIMKNLETLLQGTNLTIEQIKEALHRDEMTIIPQKPTLGRLVSMGTRYDHSLGIRAPDDDDRHQYPGYIDPTGMKTNFHCYTGGKTDREVKSILRTMSQLYEEISGLGFYQESKESGYKNGMVQYSIFGLEDL